MSDGKYSTARIPSARALGAPSVMAGTYTGAELERTCVRSGAYDAMALPSLSTGRPPVHRITLTTPAAPTTEQPCEEPI